MRLFISVFIFSSILCSCTVTEKPEFIRVKSVEVVETSLENFTLEATVVFLNKNDVGGTLQAKDFHVFIDSIDVATIQSIPFDVPKRMEFEIPFRATVPFKKVFNANKQNWLGNVLNAISKKSITVICKGNIRYKLGTFHYDYPIIYEQQISLK